MRMKPNRIGLIILISVISTGILLIAGLWLKDSITYDHYVNAREGISIKYPKGWKVVPYPDTGAIAGFVEPRANPLVMFQANWNISATPLKVPMTLDDYVKAANAQVTFMFRDVKPSLRFLDISGHKGVELVYISSKDDGLVLVTHAFIYKGTAYNVTYADDKSAWLNPERKQMIADVIHSLKVNF
jgi:hypothetical protein